MTAGFNGTWGGNNATNALIMELYTLSLYPLARIYWKAGDEHPASGKNQGIQGK
jgi:hypothetical protein